MSVSDSGNRRAVRAVLAAGILAGVATLVGLPRADPAQLGLATDVYYHAGRAALAGGDVYAAAPPAHPGYRFLYPPVVVTAVLPHALAGSPAGAYALQAALNLLTAAALAGLLVRTVERARGPLPRVDRLLIAGYAVVSPGVATTLVLGQVNLQLALAVAVGVLAVERSREAAGGVAFALAATVKLFPALVGVWLARVRAWRAILAATATGVGLLLAGAALFGPDLTVAYLTVTLPAEASVGAFAGGPAPGAPYATIRRQLAVLAPWLPAAWLLPAGALVLAPVVAAGSRSVRTRRDRLVALAATLLATLTLFPLEPFYIALALFPLVPLSYLLDPGRTRRLYLAGLLFVSVPVTLRVVEVWLGLLAPPAAVAATIRGAARTVFAFVLPPTAGIWLLLAACVRYQHRRATGRIGRTRAGERS